MPNETETLHLGRELHAGQIDKVGRAYIEHVERVAQRVADKLALIRRNGLPIDAGEAREIHTAALLHDVVEDCGVTGDDLRRMGYADAVVVPPAGRSRSQVAPC